MQGPPPIPKKPEKFLGDNPKESFSYGANITKRNMGSEKGRSDSPSFVPVVPPRRNAASRTTCPDPHKNINNRVDNTSVLSSTLASTPDSQNSKKSEPPVLPERFNTMRNSVTSDENVPKTNRERTGTSFARKFRFSNDIPPPEKFSGKVKHYPSQKVKEMGQKVDLKNNGSSSAAAGYLYPNSADQSSRNISSIERRIDNTNSHSPSISSTYSVPPPSLPLKVESNDSPPPMPKRTIGHSSFHKGDTGPPPPPPPPPPPESTQSIHFTPKIIPKPMNSNRPRPPPPASRPPLPPRR